MTSNGVKKYNLQFKQILIILLVALVIINPVAPVLASETTTFSGIVSKFSLPFFKIDEIKNISLSGNLRTRTVVSSITRTISAYNVGDIYQCAGNPCTSANGENICKALELGYKRCAANFVPFGTILEIEGYGECMVTDRMNSRYLNNVDIAMKYEEHTKALEFGRRSLTVNIIKYE